MISITGSDLTGSSGDTDRTYTVTDATFSATDLQVFISGTYVYQDVDYTVSGLVITFSGAVFDSQYIAIIYNTSRIITLTYATASDVQRILGRSAEFTESTNPTDTQVEIFISAMEDYIDSICGRAWREVTVTEEYYDKPSNIINIWDYEIRIALAHRKIKTFDTDEGDKLEIWDGNEWIDYVATKTENRGTGDFWVNYTDGFVYIRYYSQLFNTDCIRITYRYGETTVPNAISEACALLSASMILSNDDRTQLVMDAGDTTHETHADRISQWKRMAEQLISPYKELRVINF